MEPNSEIGPITFEDFTSFVMKSFSFNGFDVMPLPIWANERALKALKIVKSFYFSLIIVNFILIFISLVGYAVINLEDRSLLYTALPNLSSAPFIFFKISMVVAHRKKIAAVLLTLKEIFPVTMRQQDSINLQQQLRRAQTFSKIYAYSIVSFFCLMVAYTIKNYYQNGTDKFPWQLWIPFSYDDSRIYFVIIVWIWWLQFTISTLSFGADFTCCS